MDEIIARFREDVRTSPPGRIAEIAEATGIKLKTLRNLRYEATRSMQYEHMRKLAAYYELRGTQEPA